MEMMTEIQMETQTETQMFERTTERQMLERTTVSVILLVSLKETMMDELILLGQSLE